MALAEAGRPEAIVTFYDGVVCIPHRYPVNLRDEVEWKALALCGEAECCLDCWPLHRCDHPRLPFEVVR